MEEFTYWLSQTGLSQAIQINGWVIPTVQIIHIVAVGVVLASVLVLSLRVLGSVLPGLPLAALTRRFAPWVWAALILLAITGTLLTIGEPARELYSLSFWIKMGLLLLGIIIAVAFQRHLGRNAAAFDDPGASRGGTKFLAVLTLVIWAGIAVMGRLIAFDEPVWGSLSPHHVEASLPISVAVNSRAGE